MRVLKIYQTETDWCALVEHGSRRLTLTYAAQPSAGAVLDDAEHVLMAEETGLPPLMVDETTSAEDKQALALDQIIGVQALLNTEPELADAADMLDEVVERLSE